MLQLQKRGCGERLCALCVTLDCGNCSIISLCENQKFLHQSHASRLEKNIKSQHLSSALQFKLRVSWAFIDVCYQEIIHLWKVFKDI